MPRPLLLLGHAYVTILRCGLHHHRCLIADDAAVCVAVAVALALLALTLLALTVLIFILLILIRKINCTVPAKATNWLSGQLPSLGSKKSTRGFSGARDAATPPPDVAVALPTHGKEIFHPTRGGHLC